MGMTMNAGSTQAYLAARELAVSSYKRAVEMADSDYDAGRLSFSRWMNAREELLAMLDDRLSGLRARL